MGFIEWFMGYALVWVLLGLLTLLACMGIYAAWLFFSDRRDK